MHAPSAFDLRPRPRDLMLVDLDCFYVSVERVRDPALRGRIVVVGGSANERGVVACASYEARAYGVRAGTPLFQAAQALPRREAVFLHGDHAAYLEASAQVMEILGRFTPQVEPLSLDEAFLDLSGLERHHPSWLAAAETIYRSVLAETGLGVSIGIGGTRATASVATALAKPGGVMEVRRGEEAAFLADLPLQRLPGIGRKMRAELERFNLRTIGDLAAVPEEILTATFGRVGTTLSRRARGRDADLDLHTIGKRPVQAPTISRETSFPQDTADPAVVDGMLSYLAQRAGSALREQHLRARSVAVRLRYADFQQTEKRRRFPRPSSRDEDILQVVRALRPELWKRRVKIRLVGVTLHGLESEGLEEGGRGERQLDLFERLDVDKHVDTAIDRIRERHGFGAVVRGRALGLLPSTPTSARGFRLHTPGCSR
jgi:DNA polymerase-4